MARRIKNVFGIMLAVVAWLGGALEGTAQDEPPLRERKNALYYEIGGCGFAMINYERDLPRNVRLRVGAGYIPIVGVSELVVMPSLRFGSRRQSFSAGAGLIVVGSEDTWIWPVAEVAYRLQTSSGFLLKAALAYQLGSPMLVPGFGVGWGFGGRGSARANLRATEGTGTLRIGVKPYAEVFVDGESVGSTPLGGLRLPAGAHSIRLVHTDYQPLQREVSIRPAESVKLIVDLARDGVPK